MASSHFTSVGDAAKVLKASETTIRNWIHSSDLGADHPY